MENFMDYGLTKVIGAMNGIIVLLKLGKLPNIDGGKQVIKCFLTLPEWHKQTFFWFL